MSEIKANYLSICAIYRDLAEYLREWIEFHRLVGVEHFYLYDNLSSDDHLDVLAPYVSAGVATVHHWSAPWVSPRGHPPGPTKAFNDCLHAHRNDSRWIAFLDVDEFLFSPAGDQVSDLLVQHEAAPAVVVARYEYRSSGHVTKPDGLVIENFLDRDVELPDASVHYKTILDPARTSTFLGFHRGVYTDGLPVNENGVPVREGSRARTVLSTSRLRINHYGTKSEEEQRRKDELWKAVGHDRAQGRAATKWAGRPQKRDEAITMYVPRLHDALEGSVHPD